MLLINGEATMQINVKTEILDYDLKAIPISPATKIDGVEVPAVNMTIGSMMIQSLNNPTEADKNLAAADKVHRAVVSQDVHRAMKEGESGIVDIDAKFIGEMKELMNIFYAPLPLMRAFEILEPKLKEIEKTQ